MRPTTLLCALMLALYSSHPAAAQQKPAKVPWSAPATTRIVTETRRFASGDADLSGTLYMPQSGKPVPAIVVTHSASSPLRDAPLYDQWVESGR